MFLVLIGAWRMTVAVIHLRRLESTTSPIINDQLETTLHRIRKQMNCEHAIRLFETERSISACTLGCLAPRIILGKGWRKLTNEQLSATLAHEIAHIQNSDFRNRLIANVARVLNFYNPIVHYLYGNLVLEQEIMADNQAAQCVGGPQKYLSVLATLALAHDTSEYRLAPLFLPTRRTLIRRIRMLHSKKELNPRQKWQTRLAQAAIVLIVIAVAGIRPNISAQTSDVDPRNAATTIVTPDQVEATTSTVIKQSDIEVSFESLLSKQQADELDMANELLKAKFLTGPLKSVTEFPLFVRTAQQRVDSLNRIRQLTLALLNYESAYGHFPPSVLVSDSGKKYSWRVAILPYMEEDDLYQQYRFDEDWNSKHNLAVTKKIPAAFQHPIAVKNKSEYCSYFVVVGEKTAFGKGQGVKLMNIPDGIATTFCVVEATADIHWAEPKDLDFSDKELMKKLGGSVEGAFGASFCDGSTFLWKKGMGRNQLLEFLTRNDGNANEREKMEQFKKR